LQKYREPGVIQTGPMTDDEKELAVAKIDEFLEAHGAVAVPDTTINTMISRLLHQFGKHDWRKALIWDKASQRCIDPGPDRVICRWCYR
jgi:hypothetical protein